MLTRDIVPNKNGSKTTLKEITKRLLLTEIIELAAIVFVGDLVSLRILLVLQ